MQRPSKARPHSSTHLQFSVARWPYPTALLQFNIVSRPIRTVPPWPRASVRLITFKAARGISSISQIMDLHSRRATLASAVVAPFTLPRATLDSPTSAEIPAFPLEGVTATASPAFASVILEVALAIPLASPEAAVEA